MKTILAALFLMALLPAAASACIDPDPDSMGVYFETTASIDCWDHSPNAPLVAYLCLTRPIAPVEGFACSVHTAGAAHALLGVDFGGPGITDTDPSADGYSVVAPTPFPVLGGVSVLATFTYMLYDMTPLHFFVGPPTAPVLNCGMPIVTTAGVPRCTGLLSDNPQLPVSSVNDACIVVENESVTFGSIKSLFR